VPAGPFIFSNVSMHGYWMSEWYKNERNRKESTKMHDKLAQMFINNHLKAPQHEFVNFSDFSKAISTVMSEQGGTAKQILKM
jgi:hypothetical protein